MLVLDDESGWSLVDSHLDKAGLVVLCEPWIGFTAARLAQAQGLLRAQLARQNRAQSLASLGGSEPLLEPISRRRPDPSE